MSPQAIEPPCRALPPAPGATTARQPRGGVATRLGESGGAILITVTSTTTVSNHQPRTLRAALCLLETPPVLTRRHEERSRPEHGRAADRDLAVAEQR